MKIVNTDNYGRDYPNERFLCWVDSSGSWFPIISNREHLQKIADIMNNQYVENPRYYKIVDDDYELQPGFEP